MVKINKKSKTIKELEKNIALMRKKLGLPPEKRGRRKDDSVNDRY